MPQFLFQMSSHSVRLFGELVVSKIRLYLVALGMIYSDEFNLLCPFGDMTLSTFVSKPNVLFGDD